MYSLRRASSAVTCTLAAAMLLAAAPASADRSSVMMRGDGELAGTLYRSSRGRLRGGKIHHYSGKFGRVGYVEKSQTSVTRTVHSPKPVKVRAGDSVLIPVSGSFRLNPGSNAWQINKHADQSVSFRSTSVAGQKYLVATPQTRNAPLEVAIKGANGQTLEYKYETTRAAPDHQRRAASVIPSVGSVQGAIKIVTDAGKAIGQGQTREQIREQTREQKQLISYYRTQLSKQARNPANPDQVRQVMRWGASLTDLSGYLASGNMAQGKVSGGRYRGKTYRQVVSGRLQSLSKRAMQTNDGNLGLVMDAFAVSRSR